MLPLLLSAVALFPVPVELDRLTVEEARRLHGRQVRATFLVAKPSYTWRGRTIVGAADLPDGAERGATLKGNRLDVDDGKRATVVGRLSVIDWPGCFVGRVFVPAWVDIRVDEGE